MSRGDLETIFQALALPVVQGGFADDEKPPEGFNFVEYHIDGNYDFHADNKIYRRVDAWQVSVYGLITDMSTFYANCDALEAQLASAGIVASRHPDIFAEDGIVYAAYSFDLPR